MKLKPQTKPNLATGYQEAFETLKEDIKKSQLKASLSITKELTLLYWRTGKMLSEKVQTEGWGAKTLKLLAMDIKRSFPDLSGFSLRNLHYMRQFSNTYPDINCATAVAQIPWAHNLLIIRKLKSHDERMWYVGQTLENGWSRNMLERWIKSDLYSRQGTAVTNFQKTLPATESDLAEQLVKDPYNFSFLALDAKYREQELEQGLIDHLQYFLVELGEGFAFVGRQYRLNIQGDDYFIDLLFYHLKLRCYFVIELKAANFDPRDTGQINFYLSAVDDLLRHRDDNPSIGILICQDKNKVKAEYALRDINKPIGIASYETQIIDSLPKNLRSSLPTTEEIEAKLEQNLNLV